MIKRLLILTLVIFTSTSCVSSKLYKELEVKYTNLKNDYDSLNADSDRILNDKNTLQNQFEKLQKEIGHLKNNPINSMTDEQIDELIKKDEERQRFNCAMRNSTRSNFGCFSYRSRTWDHNNP